METEKISVIMPAFNAEKTIEKAVESILDQTWGNYELIIIDDGSTDSTPEICRSLKTRGPADIADGPPKDLQEKGTDRIRVFTQANAGPAAARNRGLEEARGGLICFVDADDTVHKDFLKVLAQGIGGAQMAVCGYHVLEDGVTGQTEIPEAGRISARRAMIRALSDHTVDGFLWNKIFRREIIRKYGLCFEKSIYVGEDLLFVEQYLSHCRAVRLVDRDLCSYYCEDRSISHALNERHLTLLYAFDRLRGLSEDPAFLRAVANRFVRQLLVFYVLFPEPVHREEMEELLSGFLEGTGFTDRQILKVLPLKYRMRFRLFRMNKKMYSSGMGELRKLAGLKKRRK